MDAMKELNRQMFAIKPKYAKLKKTYDLLNPDGSVFCTFSPADWASGGMGGPAGFEIWPLAVGEWMTMPFRDREDRDCKYHGYGDRDYEPGDDQPAGGLPEYETEDRGGVPYWVQYLACGDDRIKVLLSSNFDPQDVDEMMWTAGFPDCLLAYETDGNTTLVLPSVKDPD